MSISDGAKHANTAVPDQIQALLVERGEEYDEAHVVSGKVMAFVFKRSYPIQQTVQFLHWVMILNKLIRALASPNKKDHWLDIAGWATLAVQYLERNEQYAVSSHNGIQGPTQGAERGSAGEAEVAGS
jgi:hypothetical protein